MMNTTNDKLKAFERLLTIMDELRAQCPWDKKQTLESLRTLSIEEVYELADAILVNDPDEIKKELEKDPVKIQGWDMKTSALETYLGFQLGLLGGGCYKYGWIKVGIGHCWPP